MEASIAALLAAGWSLSFEPQPESRSLRVLMWRGGLPETYGVCIDLANPYLAAAIGLAIDKAAAAFIQPGRPHEKTTLPVLQGEGSTPHEPQNDLLPDL